MTGKGDSAKSLKNTQNTGPAPAAHKSLPVWLTLSLVCIIAAGVLALTNTITAGPIAAGAEARTLASMQAAFPSADAFSELETGDGAPVDFCFEAYENGKLTGHVVQITVTGCKGPIEILSGYDTDGRITTFSCGGTGFQETAGLGAKVKDESFRAQFSGKSIPVSYSDDSIDAVTGATISSNAVLDGINTAGYYAMNKSDVSG